MNHQVGTGTLRDVSGPIPPAERDRASRQSTGCRIFLLVLGLALCLHPFAALVGLCQIILENPEPIVMRTFGSTTLAGLRNFLGGWWGDLLGTR